MARMSSIKILFDPDEIKTPLLMDLYRIISNACGFPYDDEKFRVDCTKMNIAKNIRDNVFKAYALKYSGAYPNNPDELDTQVSMLLCMSGPMVDKDLPDNTVEVFNGAFKVDEVKAPFYVTELGLGISETEIRKISEYYDDINGSE